MLGAILLPFAISPGSEAYEAPRLLKLSPAASLLRIVIYQACLRWEAKSWFNRAG